jgi:hypothetical protein
VPENAVRTPHSTRTDWSMPHRFRAPEHVAQFLKQQLGPFKGFSYVECVPKNRRSAEVGAPYPLVKSAAPYPLVKMKGTDIARSTSATGVTHSPARSTSKAERPRLGALPRLHRRLQVEPDAREIVAQKL